MNVLISDEVFVLVEMCANTLLFLLIVMTFLTVPITTPFIYVLLVQPLYE